MHLSEEESLSMKQRMQLFAALSGVLMCLAGAPAAMAAPQIHTVAAGDNTRDSNLRWARQRVEQNIDVLQRDRHDYGGYRVRAIAFFQQAREQLTLGLQYDIRREHTLPRAALMRPDAETVHFLPGDKASDANLRAARRNTEKVIDVLQRDRADYGGHRVAAIKLLGEGREMLSAALRWDAKH